MISRLIANMVSMMPKRLVWVFSKKYIAGSTLDAGIDAAKRLNSMHTKVTLDVLGEFIHSIEQAEQNQQEYLQLIKRVSDEMIDGTISLKPTSFGLLIDEVKCYNLIHDIIQLASARGYFVRIDMEDSKCVDAELRLFKKLYAKFPEHVGIVIQAYLKRSMTDIEGLKKVSHDDHPVNIRLCKGIYVEPSDIAFKSPAVINENYLELLRFIIDSNMYPAIATHDKYLISKAKSIISNFNLNPDQYEFQMLYGVRDKLRKKIIMDGHMMRVYVPFGIDWFGYSVRRLKENPRMVSHIIQSILFFWKD